MAKIVFGLGTSHSPQLSTPLDLWKLHVERDEKNKKLYFKGAYHTYEELSQIRSPEGLEKYITQEKWLENYNASQRLIKDASNKLVEMNPDVLVVVGDDQRELFLDDNMPTFSVYWGKDMICIPRPAGKLQPSLEPARWANYGEVYETYPAEPNLGKHIVEQMMVQEFDVAQLSEQLPGRSIGHSYIFTKKRLMQEKTIPTVPVMINTYFPPNQPTAARCYAFGKALRQAIESWDSEKTVAIICSGGLSHFVVDEELDRQVLKGLKNKDESILTGIPDSELHSGTSEIRNWIAAAGALENLNVEFMDYIPSYRTSAGTGCGMAFAWWT
jgi:3-O-methylgallate 3,4-dioxygenase